MSLTPKTTYLIITTHKALKIKGMMTRTTMSSNSG